jgi:hypothetical protein
MKKLTLILLVLIISSTVISQTYSINTYASQKGYWSEDIKEWAYDNWTLQDIKFLIKEEVVVVYDKANSIYTKISTVEKDRHHYIWDTVDEKNKLCFFMMTTIPDKDNMWYIIVMYNTVLYRYAYIKN